MPCLDENVLAALVEGRIDATTRSDVEAHVDVCVACRETVAGIASLTGAVDDTPELAVTEMARTPPPSMRPERTFAVGQVIAQRFRLERIVGEGGLGVVWAATHLFTRKVVALKILKVLDPEHARRFLREARVSGTVSHPNIVDVHDIMQLESDAVGPGPLVMVMDLLEGESLDRALARRGKLPLGELVALLVPLVSAASAAHAHGIVHRDLKPQNVFLVSSKDGSPPRVMLLDFGLAKLTATEGDAAATGALTAKNAVLGTPHYMAPEQIWGEPDIDVRADVWSLAVIVYECLAGQRPVEGRSFGQIFKNLTTREIVPLRTLAPEIPSELASLVDRSLSLDRDARPASLADLARLLDRLGPAR
jgi:serine/threonine-protein kinase